LNADCSISPEAAAEQLLDRIWDRSRFPVDPVWIARQLGLDVVDAQLGNNISGALIKEPGKDPVIMLDQADSKTRKRFSCAHELGHYVRRSDQESIEYIDFRGPDASLGSDPEEIFANQFAACLLMPRSEIARLHKNKIPTFIMASQLGVSGAALGHRLKNLGI
jgi:Zn-dependent peptidase ImmA (M78 family)